MAVLLVVMTLVLNTAVLSEVHVAQTDESTNHERSTLQYQDSAERAIGGLILSINENQPAYEDRAAGLEREVEAWSELVQPEYERDGVVTNVSIDAVYFEANTTILHENASRSFTSNESATDWTLADEADDVHEFEMNVSDEYLVETNQTNECAGGEDCFAIEAEGANGEVWTMYAYMTEANGTVLTVEQSGGSMTTCETDAANITAGTFENEGCEEFTPFTHEDESLTSPYTLNFTNADRASGEYELVVEKVVTDDDRYASADSPRLDKTIEAADISVTYQSVALTYEREYRVEPGERDG